MPVASKRKTAIQNTATLLRTIVAGATYFRTLLPANVYTKVRLLESIQEGKSFIWVRAGQENLASHSDISGMSKSFEANFEILIDCTVKDASGETMVEELEDLLHDVSLCLGDDRTLGGTVVDTTITRIEPPVYGLEEMFATTTVHVVAVYDFDYGTSI